MSIIYNQKPSRQANVVLNALKEAVINALDKKQKLGQYAVMWDGEKIVKKTKFFEEINDCVK